MIGSSSTHRSLAKSAAPLAGIAIVLALAAPPAAAQSRLLVTEIAVAPTAGEFIEVYNPNGFAVDLSRYHLTDATFAAGGDFYYNVVQGRGGGGIFGDFHARFPDGASIGPGEFVTVALAGSAAYFSVHLEEPDFELWEDFVLPDAVPDMVEATPGSIADQGDLGDSGEICILYYWDGASDLVTDVDYVQWGGKDEAVDKTGVSRDGPDTDGVASAYRDDTSIVDQASLLGTLASGESWQRRTLSEGRERNAGGNGAAGDDETSELLRQTFVAASMTPGGPTPDLLRLQIPRAPCGSPSTWTVDGADPFEVVLIIIGLGEALTPFCLVEATDVDLVGGPAYLVPLPADAEGRLELDVVPPCGLGALHVQALGRSPCRFSNDVVVSS